MANICCTDYTIYGPSDELKRVAEAIEKGCRLSEHHLLQDSWIGNPLIWAGLFKDADEIAEKGIRSRGSFCYYEGYDGGEEITLSQEDAWAPQLQPIFILCKALAPNAHIVYTAIEPACDLCITNGDDAGKWLFDIQEPEKLPKCLACYDYDFVSEKEAREALCEALGKSDPGEGVKTQELADEVMRGFDYDVSIHLMEYVSVEELCGQ